MAPERARPVVGWCLAVLAILAVTVAAAEVYVLGYPSPVSLVTALLLTGTALSWPFVSGPRGPLTALPTCRECGGTAWGFSEFHFCIHCGSTRVADSGNSPRLS